MASGGSSDEMLRSKEDMKQFLIGLAKQGSDAALAKLGEYLNKLKNVPLNVCVTGRTGVGKSSFINKIMGLTPENGGAAVGVIHTTGRDKDTEALKRYANPNNPNLVFWDTPGVGAEGFPKSNYFDLIEFDRYDYFVILTHKRFDVDTDLWLAKEVQKRRKRFLFARTHIVQDYKSLKESHPTTYQERQERMVPEVWEDIKGCLGNMFNKTNVFLVDSYNVKQKYEFLNQFEAMQERLIETFPQEKREAFARSLAITSETVVHARVQVLKSEMENYVLLSGLGGLIPIPGVSTAIDLSILLAATKRFYNGLDLSEDALEKLAITHAIDVSELKKVMDTSLPFVLTTKTGLVLFLKSLSLAVGVAAFAEETGKLIPVVGSVLGAPLCGHHQVHPQQNIG